MHYTKEHLREIINLAGWTLFSRSAYQLFAKLDAFVVGLVLGPAVTPIFVLTGRAWDIALLLLERMPIAAMPSLAHLHGEGDTWHYARISKHILKMVSYISLISIGTVFALNGSFVRLWIVGKNVYAGFSFDIALSMAIGLMVFASAAYHILYAKGLIRKLCILTASLSISRAALMTGLVLLMGYIGGPLSVIIAFSAAIAVFYIPTLSYHLEISKKTVRWAVMHLAKLSVPVFALAMIVHYTINITSWPTLVITALGYAACIILVFLCIDKNVRQMAFAIAARIYRLNLV
jgi:O-antigen/teichoic acid export membrane protein